MSTSSSGKNMQGEAMVTIADDSGMIQDAMVSVEWSEATTDSDTAMTGVDGRVMLVTQGAKKSVRGQDFVATVVDATCPGHVYDPSLNKATIGRIAG